MKCLKCVKANLKKEDYCNGYCDFCFIGIIKKRVRSYFRKTKCIKPEYKLIILDDVSRWLISNCISFQIEIIDANESLKKMNSLKKEEIKKSVIKKSTKDVRRKGSIKKGFIGNINTELLKSIAAKEKADAVLLPITLDNEVHCFLESLFSESFSIPRLQPPFISILTTITHEEIKRLCRLKNLNFEFEKNDAIYTMINDIEKKYRGKKFSLSSSLQELKKLSF